MVSPEDEGTTGSLAARFNEGVTKLLSIGGVQGFTYQKQQLMLLVLVH